MITGATLSPYLACTPMSNQKESPDQPLTNWAGNLEYSTSNVHYPATVEAVQEVVRKCSKLKALGSQHSFNRIADSTENQLSLKALNKVVSLDKTAHTVTVESGTKYGELAPYLHENGFALHNLASLPHISIAGSIATATHGSGIENGNLATGVSAIEFVNAAGEVINLSRKKDGEQFSGAVINLGALGVLTKVTLDLLPTFRMSQLVYLNLPMQALRENFLAIMSAGYSVSLFTDWRNQNVNQVWIKSRVEEGTAARPAAELYGATLATNHVHPVEGQSAENCTEQLGTPGTWYERMPHFKMGFKPSAGKELQSEYFVPIEHAYEAMMAIEKLHEKISPHLFISEIRAIRADDCWMSPCYKRDCMAIHTTWKQEVETVMGLLPLIEEQLAPFQAKPHWGKLFTLSPSVLHSCYEKLADFKQLLRQYDPSGKFVNEFLSETLYGK